jgi:hypothetical protein
LLPVEFYTGQYALVHSNLKSLVVNSLQSEEYFPQSSEVFMALSLKGAFTDGITEFDSENILFVSKTPKIQVVLYYTKIATNRDLLF